MKIILFHKKPNIMKYILFVAFLFIGIPGNCNSFRTKQDNEKNIQKGS